MRCVMNTGSIHASYAETGVDDPVVPIIRVFSKEQVDLGDAEDEPQVIQHGIPAP